MTRKLKRSQQLLLSIGVSRIDRGDRSGSHVTGNQPARRVFLQRDPLQVRDCRYSASCFLLSQRVPAKCDAEWMLRVRRHGEIQLLRCLRTVPGNHLRQRRYVEIGTAGPTVEIVSFPDFRMPNISRKTGRARQGVTVPAERPNATLHLTIWLGHRFRRNSIRHRILPVGAERHPGCRDGNRK